MRTSIVIAAHNEGESLWKTIGACVETAAGLDHEIIVADDASSDGSIEETQRRFPRVRVVRHDQRQGASPAKDLGARQAHGEVLVFLDGHANPEPGAIRRLVEDVEHLKGRAIVTPTVAALDTRRWRNTRSQVGHGYFLDLERFHCGWLPLNELREVPEGRRKFYESPALIGCAVALGRELYEDLGGFDPHMRSWGVEDLDLSLRCWLMGHPILHDPEAVVGHRFRAGFDNYAVPPEDFVANQLRMARKNFTHGTWSDWVDRCRLRHSGRLADYPEGLWARVWHLFEEGRLGVEQERSYLMARRSRDEFWYAGRFGLTWPRLHSSATTPGTGPGPAASAPLLRAEATPLAFGGAMAVSPSPSPPPPPPEPPPTPPCEGDPDCCDCGCSAAPVRYFNGEVQLAVTDLEIGGYGKPWQHRRVYSNQLSSNANFGNGYNWLVEQWPYLIQYGDGSVTVVRGTTQSLWFDPSGGGYVGRYGAKSALTHDTTNHLFVLALPTGEQWTFQDFDQATYPQGLLKSQRTAGGQTTQVTSYTTDGHIGEIQRSTTLGGVTTTESFLYAYNSDGQATSLTLRSQVNGGTWNPIRNVVYEYYAGGESYGSPGDLKRARIQVPQGGGWVDIQIHYYRYYLSGAPNGFVHGLKYVVKPNTYATMTADGLDPTSVADAVLAQYADQYLQYDSDRRVTLEALDGGSRTYTFAFTPGGNPDDYNNWAMKTVETWPDGSQNVVYTNYIGQILLKMLRAGSDSWINYYQFDSTGHQTMRAMPSAIAGFNDMSANLGVTFNANLGQIWLTDYYTSTGAGAAPGYPWRERIQQGSGGTAVSLLTYTYTSVTAGWSTIYLPASVTTFRNTDGTGAITESFSYTYYSGTTQVQQKTTTLPVVSIAQNGSGTAASKADFFDSFGQATWKMDERGFITAFDYDVPTGALVQKIDDVSTSLTGGAPSGWTTPTGGGLNLVTDYQFDALGRRTRELGPQTTIDIGGIATVVFPVTWTIHQDVTYQVWIGRGYATGSASSYAFFLYNPISITVKNPANKTVQEIAATRSSPSGALLSTDSFPQSSYTRWKTYQFTECCLLASERTYFKIPSSGVGTAGTNYNETDYGYDSLKRRNRVTSPGGTITFNVFDARDNEIARYIGTDDTGATQADPTGGGTGGNNMVLVTESQYDGGQGGGDNNLTKSTEHVDINSTRVTTYLYDWRNRRTDTAGPVDLYLQTTYDNLDAETRSSRYNTSPSGNLIVRNDYLTDDRGRIYQTTLYSVDPNTGAVGNALVDNIWFDAGTNVIKSQHGGSQLFTKKTYDGLGRLTAEYTGFGSDSSYAAVGSVANNTILEQVEWSNDPAGWVILTTTRQRYHNAASQTGVLGNPSTQPNARVTYRANYFDARGYRIESVDFGTNGGATLNRPVTIPAGSNTILVTRQSATNTRGEFYQTILPGGRVDQSQWDDAGRLVTAIENYIDGDPTTGTDDQDRMTNWTYTPDGMIASITVAAPDTGNQVTSYTYGTTLAESQIASSMLKRFDILPDSSGGSDQIAYTYNRLGQPTSITDQNGTVRSITYDGLGRTTADWITTLGAGVDGSVLRIETAYTSRGLRSAVTSYDNATVGQGNVIDQAQFQYNGFNQVVADYQEHGGAVNISTTPVVRYGYADGSANTIRPTTLTYPNGRVLSILYGTAGGNDDSASRITSLIDNDGSTSLAGYSYLGKDVIVVVGHDQPQLQFTLANPAGSNDPDTGDIYSGFDRFGRIKDNRWFNTASGSDVDRVKYGYDQAGNRLFRQNTVAESLGQGFDELYTVDGLYRLSSLQRGTLSSNQTAITGKTFAQAWTLGVAGNWSTYNRDDNGNGTWDLVQNRSANPVNEITAITESTGPTWATPAYDHAGNITSMPQPANPTGTYAATYDGWNRLIKVVEPASGNEVSEFRYDGTNRRIIQRTFSAGSLTETRHLYNSAPSILSLVPALGVGDFSQVLEARVGTATAADRQFVWGLRYPDDLVLRDRHTPGNTGLNERLYVVQDANWNVTAVTNSSGTIQERYAYTAYGQVTFLNGQFASPSTTSAVAMEDLFTGRKLDTATGLFFLRARYYHPTLGQFLGRAPIGYESRDYNLNQYVAGNPVRATDPSGLDCPGCDIPDPLANGNSCTLACCAQHDQCYSTMNPPCQSSTWWKTIGDECKKIVLPVTLTTCEQCNVQVAQCFTDCRAAQLAGVPDPMLGKPLFFCAATKTYFVWSDTKKTVVDTGNPPPKFDHNKWDPVCCKPPKPKTVLPPTSFFP